MRKKLLVLALAAVVGGSTIPVANISARAIPSMALRGDTYDDEEVEGDAEELDDAEEADESTEVTKGDIVVSPAKKTIKIGKSFYIDLYPSDKFDEENGDLPDEEWEELLSENIDDITFRSTRSSVASVNSKGKVKGKKKGSAIIKTTVSFRDGSEGTYKTKVYVTR